VKLVNYRNSFFMLLGLVSAAALGMLYFNVSTIAENSSSKGKNEKLQIENEKLPIEIKKLQKEIKKFQKEIKKRQIEIEDASAKLKDKTAAFSSLATVYNSEIDYLASLEILKRLSKKYQISIDEILPRLENTLPDEQGELTDPEYTVERYALDLRVAGQFLSIGQMLDDLEENDFAIRSLEINTGVNGSNVHAVMGLYSYRLVAK